MAEGTYEYECMRAELLGIEKPNYEEFMKKKEESGADEPTEEEIDLENVKETEQTGENLGRISGGLEELNSILQVTQKKISKFKASCGSLTNLLKIKIGQGTSSSDPLEVETSPTPPSSSTSIANTNGDCPDAIKSDLSRAFDNHVDKLDSLLDKAENAHFSMTQQNKEMKRFLH